MRKRFLISCFFTFLMFFMLIPKASADPDRMVHQVVGTITACFVGPMFAVPRGIVKGAVIGTKKVAGLLGNENGKWQRFAGAVSGGFAGGAAGVLFAMLRSERDAFKYGFNDPWSYESFSLGGEDLLDYDPFDWEER